MVQYIYMFAQEEDDSGTAVVLMGVVNNYSSGLFQLLGSIGIGRSVCFKNVYTFWQEMVISDYGHSCNKPSDFAFSDYVVLL